MQRDLTPEQRETLVATLTTHHHIRHDGLKRRCTYCENYYGELADKIGPDIAQMLADERERIAREIEGLDYEHHSPLGSVFKHPNEMKRDAARIARGLS